MLVRVGSLQTQDEFWINPDHVVSIRVDRTTRAATIKLSDWTTHSVRTSTASDAREADLSRVLTDSPRPVGRIGRAEAAHGLAGPEAQLCAGAPVTARPEVLDAQALIARSFKRSAP